MMALQKRMRSLTSNGVVMSCSQFCLQASKRFTQSVWLSIAIGDMDICKVSRLISRFVFCRSTSLSSKRSRKEFSAILLGGEGGGLSSSPESSDESCCGILMDWWTGGRGAFGVPVVDGIGGGNGTRRRSDRAAALNLFAMGRRKPTPG